MRPVTRSYVDESRPRACCMVVHSYYPADPRVRREAEALVADGWSVDVVCLRDAGEPAREDCRGVQVHRLPVRRHRGSGLAVYLLEYLQFFFLAFWRVAWLGLKRRFTVVQSHNMPDFLVFTGLVPRLLGARLVHDMHDLVPELFGVRFGGNPSHPAVKLTGLVENASTRFADHIVTVGEALRERLVGRGVPPGKVTVVMNTADPGLFTSPTERTQGDDSDKRFRLVYHGGLYERYGVDIAIRTVAKLGDQIPGLSFYVYGSGEAEAGLRRLAADLGVDDRVHLAGFVPLERIPGVIAAADLGVVPYRKNPFTDFIYPTKAFEYIAMGVPVVIARTDVISRLFGDVEDMFFSPGDPDALAALIVGLYREPARRQALLAAAQKAYEPYRWENQRDKYLALMRRLARPASTVAGSSVAKAEDRHPA